MSTEMAREDHKEIESDLPWDEKTHSLLKTIYVTEKNPMAENPCRFNLYHPQRSLLYTMIKLETRRSLKLSSGSIEPLMARLSAGFSFGKTVLALALIAANKLPNALPFQRSLILLPESSKDSKLIYRGKHSQLYMPEIVIRYNTILPITIVASAANVITQWVEETIKYTDLRYFIVDNVRNLKKFEALYRSGDISNYDVLFVKAGKVTSNYIVPGEKQSMTSTRSIFNALISILEGVVVSRLFIDDYDTLKLTKDDCYIPALFTWLISATKHNNNSRVVPNKPPATISDFFRQINISSRPIRDASSDTYLNTTLSIQCSDEYVDRHINCTVISYIRIVVPGQVNVILRNLEVSKEIIEMINGDAINTAARALGIDASSIGDVIRRVVGKHLQSLRRAIHMISYIENILIDYVNLPRLANSEDSIMQLTVAIQKNEPALLSEAMKNITGFNVDMQKDLLDLIEKNKSIKVTCSNTMSRMRDNMREGECQCCRIPLDRSEAIYVLVECCQIIVCESCITENNRGVKKFINMCPNCAICIDATSGLFRVGVEFDLGGALEEEKTITEAIGVFTPTTTAETDSPNLLTINYSNKLKALIQYVNDAKVECISMSETQPHIKNLLCGRKDIEWPVDKKRKYLIFTMHQESTRLISKALDENKIGYCVLTGTRANRDHVVHELRDSKDINIMLVTAAKDCAGLNLPFISDTIFYHVVINEDVGAQVAGRGQRIGRTHNYRITTMVNATE